MPQHRPALAEAEVVAREAGRGGLFVDGGRRFVGKRGETILWVTCAQPAPRGDHLSRDKHEGEPMPSYKKVIWRHDYPDQPVLLYSETGDDGYEARKVDLYRDGRQDYADESTSIGTTFLAQEPEPPLEEIAAAPLISEAVPGSGAEPRDGCAPPPSWPLCPGESTRCSPDRQAVRRLPAGLVRAAERHLPRPVHVVLGRMSASVYARLISRRRARGRVDVLVANRSCRTPGQVRS